MAWGYFAVKFLGAQGGDANGASFMQFGTSIEKDLAIIFMVTIFAPLGEEFIFRGVMLRSLRDGLGQYKAIGIRVATILALLASGVIFASIHGAGVTNPVFWTYVISSVVYALVYLWSGSLSVAIFAHAVNNVIATLFPLVYGQTIPFSSPVMYAVVIAGPFIAWGIATLVSYLYPSRPLS